MLSLSIESKALIRSSERDDLSMRLGQPEVTIKILELVAVSNSFRATVVEEVLSGHLIRLLASKLLSIRILEVLHLRERVMGKEAKQIINRISVENPLEDFSPLDIRCQTIPPHNNIISLKRMCRKGV
jgi:hypothetical protein